jgi:hypothetical protein
MCWTSQQFPAFAVDVKDMCSCLRASLIFNSGKKFARGFTLLGLLGLGHELLEDVRGHAAPFAPNLESLQDVLLCPREASTAYHSKPCAYSK